MDEPVTLQFGPSAAFRLTDVRVVDHPRPLALLGADILRGGRSTDGWNFNGLTYTTTSDGKVTGSLVFQRATDVEVCPLAHSPTDKTNMAPKLNFIQEEAFIAPGPPTWGDQCL